MQRNQRVDRVVAQRGRKRDFLFGRRTGLLEGWCAEMIAQLLRQHFDLGGAIAFVRLHDLHQRRPAERRDAEEPRPELRARLALQRARIRVPEYERAAHRPLAWLSRTMKDKRVGRIEPDGAKELHARGPPSAGSNHAGRASLGNNASRSTSAFAARRISKSPLSSISRRSPGSRASRSR